MTPVYGKQDKIFVTMILMLIFAEALDLCGFIINFMTIIVAGKGKGWAKAQADAFVDKTLCFCFNCAEGYVVFVVETHGVIIRMSKNFLTFLVNKACFILTDSW